MASGKHQTNITGWTSEVQQRGIAATKDILLKCLEGVPLQDNHPVLVVDCLPNRFLGTTSSNQLHVASFAQFVMMSQQHIPNQNRFAEWSSACLELQLDKITSENNNGANLHYMGIFLDDDMALSAKTAGNVAGKLMSSWWDQSVEAGSKRRPHSTFDTPLPTLEVLTVSDGVCRTLTFKE